VEGAVVSFQQEMKEIIKEAVAAGWTVAHTRSSHLMLTHPSVGKPQFLSGTPSDWRAIANSRAQLARAMRAGAAA
jgi:predicted RNA binding protein YcfA (HicA-like mRNA interferase family)